ncbi:MAG: nickel-dependent hydrogenase large subunit, partial [Myxococcota bacterium]
MASTINLSIDPVSRIEGHLRVDLEITDGMVASARSSGTSFRGFEGILIGRDPRDAAHITQRICGVCPVPHARNSSEAFEAAAGLKVSAQAVNIRNVIQAANFIESHILHFYVLSLPDYVAGLPTAGMWPQGKAPMVWKEGAALDSLDWNAAAYEAISIVHACHELATIFGG